MTFTRKHQLYLLKNKQQYNELKTALAEVTDVTPIMFSLISRTIAEKALNLTVTRI